ncbi:uncharacterized protein [Panulirus ornatus]|uniref:uncharacterized protein isoform X1 n=1 Tax=Panulirus ornatus TaxID=150431 RepID=UPI003A862F20
MAKVYANAQDLASECPSPNGYFADSRQCDKYYQCTNNVLTEKLCPDGLAFNDIDPAVEKCDLLHLVDCSGRSLLQPPKPTEHCERQNGNFAPRDVPSCQQAYRCVDGVSSLITCPEGLAFALETGICDWPDQSGRKDCNIEKTQNFSCPRVGADEAATHPRYADPNDCQYFYVCINGQTPRRNGCAFGQVFSTNTSTCLTPKEVPECSDYYTDYFDEYFASVEADPSKIRPDIVNAAIAAGYDVPTVRNRVRIQPGAQQPSRRGPVSEAPARVTTTESPRVRQSGTRPQRRRIGGGIRSRKPTTTTTTPPPEYYDDYYYDYPEGSDATSPDSGSVSNPIADNDVPFAGDSRPASTNDAPLAVDSPASGSNSEARSSPTRTNLPIRFSLTRP